MKQFFPALVLSLATVSMAVAADLPAKKVDNILVDQNGMTLYMFDKDVANSGKSACNDACASNWPPLVAEEGATPDDKFSIITRDDGTKQWAYDGKPLYLYRADKQPGDREGDNFRDIWHVVKG
jgi:predicted lipoprotein with Yx(FWY)xxD motif